MARTGKFKVKQVEEALRASGGIFSIAAVQLRCAPNTVKNYVKRHPTLQRAVDSTVEENLDIAEAQLLKQIRKGNLGAICFYLKCKGKNRGYIERGELTGPDGGAVQTEATIVRLPSKSPNAEQWAEQNRPQ